MSTYTISKDGVAKVIHRGVLQDQLKQLRATERRVMPSRIRADSVYASFWRVFETGIRNFKIS